MSIPLRILIIEDSEDDMLLLLQELRRGGYEPVYERVQSDAEMSAALKDDRRMIKDREKLLNLVG